MNGDEEQRAVVWISEQIEDGEVGFRIGRVGDELVADFVGLGVLRATRAGVGAFEPALGADPGVVAKVNAGLVPALLRHLRGGLTLHGSAVAFAHIAEFANGAIACVGQSGAGKSTAAARLCESQSGILVADDTVAVEFSPQSIDVVPTERVSWLVTEGAKLPVVPRAAAQGPSRLVAMCHLVFDDHAVTPSFTRLRGHAALAALLPAVIRFVLDEPEAQLREAESLSKLAAQIPIFELRRSRKADTLDACMRILMTLAGAPAEGP